MNAPDADLRLVSLVGIALIVVSFVALAVAVGYTLIAPAIG